MPHPRIFLLSPANSSGKRARMVMNPNARFDLAVKLRTRGATIAELYTFMSGLYFRGKAAYSSAFASPPDGIPGSFVITPGLGLLPADTVLTVEQLDAIASIPVDVSEPRYLRPLERDARRLAASCPAADIVLLGSVASAKYVEPLLAIFDARLLFPSDFVGRGDMSRGGLMLRCAGGGVELAYQSVQGARLRGRRPPRLAPRSTLTSGI